MRTIERDRSGRGREPMSPDAAFRAIADTLPQIVWTADVEGAVTWFSRRWYARTGLDEDASLGFGYLSALHPDDAEPTLRHWEAALRDGESYEAQFRLRVSERGDHRWFLGRAEAQRDDRGRIVQWRGTSTDIEALTDVHERRLGATIDDLRRELAIEHRSERERAELFRRFHATLAHITEESLSGDLDPAFHQRVLDHAVRLVPGAQAGSLVRRDARGDWAFVALAGYDRDLMELRLPAAAKEDVHDAHDPYVVNGFEPHPSLSADTEAKLYGPLGRAAEIRSTLVVPIRIGGVLRAFLHLDNLTHPNAFVSDTIELGRLFGRQIGTVMQRLELERDLLHQARTDVVTGVPNRRRAEELLGHWLEQGRSGAVLFMDLDDFKHVNEAHGHGVGDEVLRQVAARITSLLHREQLLARWGGDEFIVILPDVADAVLADIVAYELGAGLRVPFDVHGTMIITSVSVGISLFGDGTIRVEQAVLEADIALNQAKRQGKRRVVTFSHPMGTATSRRFAIESALRDALARGGGDLRVQYQARVEPGSCEVVGVEALARWTHPELGELSPSEFVPIAEESRLIDDLTRWVLDQAARQARRWRDEGTERVVAVNLSAACIRREDIVRDIRAALEAYDLPSSALELEVTETAAMSGMRESIENLESLRDLGVSLSIDDFGTAYSSLTYLRLLPVDTIKVDRSFVSHIADDIADSPTESSIVQGIVALGRSLGMRVVAEGVETAAQADFLTHLGCDGMQGFYFGAAQPAEAITVRRGR